MGWFIALLPYVAFGHGFEWLNKLRIFLGQSMYFMGFGVNK